MSLFASLIALAAAAPAPAQEPARDDFLVLYMADAEEIFSDPKDRALLDALRMIDDRLAELQGEVSWMPPLPPDVLPLLSRLVGGEKVLRVGLSNDGSSALPIPIYAQLNLPEANAAEAAELAATVNRLLETVGMPAGQPTESGLAQLPLPPDVPIAVHYGPLGRDFVVAAGGVTHAPLDLGHTGLPTGIAPTFAMQVDVGTMVQLGMGFLAAEAPTEAAQIQRFVTMLGLDEFEMHMASGSDDERSYGIVRYPGYAANMREAGLLPIETLSMESIQVIPADAVWAAAGTVNLHGILQFVLDMFEEEIAATGMGDPIEMIANFTGFHVEEDILDNLGSTWGMYASDTTGGGGLLSAVFFMDLADAEGLTDTKERMEDMINGLLAAETEGYVQIRPWEHGGLTYSSITFPGIPIPFEPTCVFTEEYMFVGLTPQAAIGAVAQTRKGDGGLLANPRFKEQFSGGPEGLYGIGFFDSPRLIADGYGLTSLACSALVNGTRSRADATRDAGIIMPSYHELAHGAKATVTTTRVIGDDYVTESRADKSVLVGVTSLVGFVASSPLLLAIPAALMWGVRSEQVYYAESAAIEMVPVEHGHEADDHQHDGGDR